MLGDDRRKPIALHVAFAGLLGLRELVPILRGRHRGRRVWLSNASPAGEHTRASPTLTSEQRSGICVANLEALMATDTSRRILSLDIPQRQPK